MRLLLALILALAALPAQAQMLGRGLAAASAPLPAPGSCVYATDGGCSASLALDARPPQHPDFFNSGTHDGYAAQSGLSFIAGVYTGSISGTTLTIASAPDLSACVAAQCTLADDASSVAKGTYIIANIDSTHWTVSLSQTVPATSIAAVRRPAENMCGVEYHCGATTDFAGIIASGNAAAIDAINPAVNTPAGCTWNASGWAWSASEPYLSCSTTGAVSIAHLYMGPIAAYGGGSGGRAAHGCTGIAPASNAASITFLDLAWDADPGCSTNLTTASGVKLAAVSIVNGYTGPVNWQHITVDMHGLPGDPVCPTCWSAPGYTLANLQTTGAFTSQYFWYKDGAGQYNSGGSASTSTLLQQYQLIENYGNSVAQGHLEVQTLGPWALTTISDSIYVQQSGSTLHQAAWRSRGQSGNNGSLQFGPNNVLAWNDLGIRGANFLASFRVDPPTGGQLGGVITLTSDITAQTCIVGAATNQQCKLVKGASLNNTAAEIWSLTAGDGYHAGSQFYYNCGVQTATSMCPNSTTSYGYYYGAPASTVTQTNISVGLGVTNYTGFDGSGPAYGTSPNGTAPINCGGTMTDYCVVGNFIAGIASQLPGNGYWGSGVSCASKAVFQGNFDILTGASINAFTSDFSGGTC